MMERKQIVVSEILKDLANGLTRFKSDDFGHGSIEGKYDMTVGEVKELFEHPALKARKTKRLGVGLSFDIIDDTTEETPFDNIVEDIQLLDEHQAEIDGCTP